MEVYNVEKSYVRTDVVVRTSNWSSDDNRHMEFFRIHMLFTSLRLVIGAWYLISPSLMVDGNFVRKHDKSSVVHLLEPAIKRCLKGSYIVLESSTDMEGSTNIHNAHTVMGVQNGDQSQC